MISASNIMIFVQTTEGNNAVKHLRFFEYDFNKNVCGNYEVISNNMILPKIIETSN